MASQGLLAVLVGFGLGVKHALEPDHLVAVGTLMRGESRRRRLLQLGALWGAGHMSTLAVGVTLLTLLRVTLTNSQLAFFETPVALMLIVLGLWSLAAAARTGEVVPDQPNRSATESGRPAWWSFAVGAVHGLAGTGALVVLVAATVHSISATITYVVMFGTGALLGMACITTTLSLPLHMLRHRPTLARLMAASAGGVSVCLGVTMVLAMVRIRS